MAKSSQKVDAEIISIGKIVLENEAEALRMAASRLDSQFAKAVETILKEGSKVIVTGMGKSGLIGQKMVATFRSCGFPAVFLHPAEATHGDLGLYLKGDPTIMISKSGATYELVSLLPFLRKLDSSIIAILGNLESPLARNADIVLDARVVREADGLNVAPTSSSSVALGIGDALAVGLMKKRNFSDKDFASYHPNGQLGRNILLSVKDLMHPFENVAIVKRNETLRKTVILMTKKPLGAACVIDVEGKLEGIVTDGDIRRALQHHEDIRGLLIKDIMTKTPISTLSNLLIKDAIQIMEDRESQISVLPVVDDDNICIGLLRIHDIYQAELR